MLTLSMAGYSPLPGAHSAPYLEKPQTGRPVTRAPRFIGRSRYVRRAVRTDTAECQNALTVETVNSYYRMSSNSTSNTSTLCGGMLPTPWAP